MRRLGIGLPVCEMRIRNSQLGPDGSQIYSAEFGQFSHVLKSPHIGRLYRLRESDQLFVLIGREYFRNTPGR